MDDRIKSAAEIALEKIEKLGDATEEERLGWKYLPEGKKMAARYLKGDYNLVAELNRYDETVKQYIVRGVADILIRNINLPKDDVTEKNNKRAMDGIKNVKTDKVKVENLYSNIRRVFNHYLGQGKQQRQQAYESLKVEFEAKLQQAIQQQLGTAAGGRMDVEGHPQFQEQWRQLQAQLDSQYLKLLSEYKMELSVIS